ncbi:MAG: hypothetical protein OHK0013_00620 [Sandaracinaceae bacterium]
MIPRLSALLRKELAQHAAVIGLVLLLSPLAWVFFLLATLGAPTTISYTEIHVSFMRVVLVPLAFAVGNRLVVTELYGRTQLFLEALPVGRSEPFVVKWILGALVLVGVGLASMLGAVAVASAREPIDTGFLLSLGARTIVFTLTLWSFLFTMGLLGKLRVPIYLVLSLVLVVLVETTELELLRLGPIALIGPDMPLSRAGVPWSETLVSLGIALGFVMTAVVLLSVREGSLQEVLSKPMSSRELAMVGIASVTVLVVWTGLQPPPQPAPYQMSGEHVVRARSVPLVVGYARPEARAAAEALVAQLEPSLLSLRDAMGWSALPESRVVLRASLDGRTFEQAALRAGDGALVRANFLPEARPDLVGLEAALVRALLDDRSHGRARFEPQAWVRAGFPLWWAACGPHRARGSGCALSLERRAIAQLALHDSETGSRGVDRARIVAWDTLREEEGERVAESLGATGIATLARLGGASAPASFARALFGTWAPDDSRVVLSTLWSPPHARLVASTSVDEATLHSAWRADLEADRAQPEIAALLGRVSPRPSARLAILPREGSQRVIAVDVEVPWARTDGVTITVQTQSLPPFDRVVEPWEPRRDTFVLGPGERTRRIELTGRVARGDRVLVLVDVEDPERGVGAPTRVLATRRDVP